MNNRFFLAVLASAAVAFLGGWLIFGLVFANYYNSHTYEHARVLMKDPPVMWAIAIANLAWSLLITWLLQKNGSNTFGKGFMTSLSVSFLIMLVFDISMYAFWDIYELEFLAMDIIISTLFWAIMGGIAGAVLGSGKKEPASP